MTQDKIFRVAYLKQDLLIISQFLTNTCFSYGTMLKPVSAMNKSNINQELVLRSRYMGKNKFKKLCENLKLYIYNE